MCQLAHVNERVHLMTQPTMLTGMRPVAYSTTWDGEIACGTLVVGKGAARAVARSIAGYMTAAARSAPADEPCQFVTGNTMAPPLRHFSDADRIWNAANGAAAWTELVNEIARLLTDADVFLDITLGGHLFVADLRRFEGYILDPEMQGERCARCGKHISQTKGTWFSDDDDFMCPDGEEQHRLLTREGGNA